MENLKVTLYQSYLFWENIDKNLYNIEVKLSSVRRSTDLIVLPEMFSTGFTMRADKLAEPMEGKTMTWMNKIAKQNNCVVTGSLIIKENNLFYNRLIWMRPDGTYEHYDKKHLFAMAKENETYTEGEKKLIVELKGWKICPVICYDLRFPVWLRNRNSEYDLLLIAANWPERRVEHWRILINARAIENQAFVIGVNRVGHDGNDINHTGDSTCVDPNGNVIYHKQFDEDIYTVTLVADELKKTRRTLPFLRDADEFTLI